MKQKVNIKTIINILPILGLALLLLLSPCKVRNFIEAELGIPQTEVSSLNKTTISNSNCADLNSTNRTIVQKNSHSKNLPAILADLKLTFYVSDFSSSYIHPPEVRKHSTSTVPLYILYQNFKDYL
ncbi:hypothetical protein CW731_01315 [Polaribacter sp. ALD11]|uniref:hypothetical protein n=1 Tax=Polaribacter sp. ALD11 TaxID=2058137 RepID=UPI000C30496C|nr:hypothetical protein [Polaribacter sp. ALD11]AUC84012.1 hypothetical protein CW731_01315 [Polaribacter sp. ALD11]